MSKLEQLINELCPDGVEYKSLEKICKFQNGFAFKSSKFLESGLPILRITNIVDGKIDNNSLVFFNPEDYSTNLDSYVVKKNNIVVAMSGATTGKIGYNYSENEYYLNQRVGMFIPQEEKLNNRFLYHWLIGESTNIYNISSGSGAQPNLSSVKMMSLEIPLPPLPVQEEIVRILDTFTELTAELTTELTMRKQQYEYYRDSLLIHNKFSEKVLLKSVVKKGCSGGTPRKGEEKFYLNGTVPWLRTQDVKFNEIFEINSFITEEAVKKTSAKWIPANCVIVAISGATAGRCAINKIPTTTNQHCYNMEIDETKAIYKYIYYCVCSQYEELLSRKQGARGDLNSSLILGISIPLPSLEEQQRIVDILDRFDTFVNDIKEGLPAEIEARQKQYEYYRDKLLTFKKLEK